MFCERDGRRPPSSAHEGRPAPGQQRGAAKPPTPGASRRRSLEPGSSSVRQVVPCGVDETSRTDRQSGLGLRDRLRRHAPSARLCRAWPWHRGSCACDHLGCRSRGHDDLGDGAATGEVAAQLGGLNADGRGSQRDRARPQPTQAQTARVDVQRQPPAERPPVRTKRWAMRTHPGRRATPRKECPRVTGRAPGPGPPRRSARAESAEHAASVHESVSMSPSQCRSPSACSSAPGAAVTPGHGPSKTAPDNDHLQRPSLERATAMVAKATKSRATATSRALRSRRKRPPGCSPLHPRWARLLCGRPLLG